MDLYHTTPFPRETVDCVLERFSGSGREYLEVCAKLNLSPIETLESVKGLSESAACLRLLSTVRRKEDAWDFHAQKALGRMRRAHRRGSGCYLTREMIENLSITEIGSLWSEANPLDD